tara:strand:- start:110 stop:1849 length:1740 start_codon:yes stop_codon:yes gene_type:complete
MASAGLLPPVNYTASKAFAPSGYRRAPTEAFFSQSTQNSLRGPTAETDLRDASEPKGKKRLKKGKGKKRSVTWGKLSVEDPMRDVMDAGGSNVVNSSMYSQSGLTYGNNITADGLGNVTSDPRSTRTDRPGNAGQTQITQNYSYFGGSVSHDGDGRQGAIGSATYNNIGQNAADDSGVTDSGQGVDTSASHMGTDVTMVQAGTTNENVNATDTSGAVNTGQGVAEGRHVEATGLNMSDDWVPHTVKSDNPSYKIDAASVAFESVTGNIRGFKNISGNKTNALNKLSVDTSVVKSVIQNHDSKHDYSLSMLDAAVAKTEDPFGRRKWNPKQAMDVASQSVRGLININHEGALQKTRGMNQFRNQHIRKAEPDFGYEETSFVDEELPGFTDPNAININGVFVDNEDRMFWDAPNGNAALDALDRNQGYQRDGSGDIIHSQVQAGSLAARAAGGAGDYQGAGFAATYNAMASDDPWKARPGQSSRGWQGAMQPGLNIWAESYHGNANGYTAPILNNNIMQGGVSQGRTIQGGPSANSSGNDGAYVRGGGYFSIGVSRPINTPGRVGSEGQATSASSVAHDCS